MNRPRIVRRAEHAYGDGRGRDAHPPPAATTVLATTGRATVFAVSRIDGLIGTLERGPDLLAPLDAYLFRIIETPRVGGTTAVSYV
jgi:hypothetical protein